MALNALYEFDQVLGRSRRSIAIDLAYNRGSTTRYVPSDSDNSAATAWRSSRFSNRLSGQYAIGCRHIAQLLAVTTRVDKADTSRRCGGVRRKPGWRFQVEARFPQCEHDV